MVLSGSGAKVRRGGGDKVRWRRWWFGHGPIPRVLIAWHTFGIGRCSEGRANTHKMHQAPMHLMVGSKGGRQGR